MSNLLQGVIYCGKCGATMQYVNKSSKSFEFYLRCSKASIKACLNSKLYRYQLIERSVIEIIGLEHFGRKVAEQSKSVRDEQQLDIDIANKNQELRILNRKVDALLSVTQSSSFKIKIESFSKEIKQKEDELKSLKIQKRAKSDNEEEYINSLTYEDISKGTSEERIEFNRYLKEKIELSFDPNNSVKVRLLPPRYSKAPKKVLLMEIVVNGTDAHFRYADEFSKEIEFTFVDYSLGETSVKNEILK